MVNIDPSWMVWLGMSVTIGGSFIGLIVIKIVAMFE